jgi:hypothetical protein
MSGTAFCSVNVTSITQLHWAGLAGILALGRNDKHAAPLIFMWPSATTCSKRFHLRTGCTTGGRLKEWNLAREPHTHRGAKRAGNQYIRGIAGAG